MQKFLIALLTSALSLGAVALDRYAGVLPRPAQPQPPPDAVAAAPADPAPPAAEAPTRRQVYAPPVPTDPKEHPTTVAGITTGKKVEASLQDIREAADKLRKEIAASPAEEKGLAAAADALRGAVKRLRADVDGMRRSTSDLIPELLSIDYDYRAAASRFESRAAGYADPQLKLALEKLAADIQFAADDAPRRAQAATRFLANLNKNAARLGEMDRALGDISAAAVILEAGSVPASVAPQAIALDALVQRFLGLVDAFTEEVKAPPRPEPEADKKPEPEPKTQPEAKVEPKPETPKSEPKPAPPAAPEPLPDVAPRPEAIVAEKPAESEAPKPEKEAAPDTRYALAVRGPNYLCAKCRQWHPIPKEGVTLGSAPKPQPKPQARTEVVTTVWRRER